MELQNPTIPASPVPPASPTLPKKNNLVVILLSVLLVITLLISGYLFLQVQKLTKQLSQLQVQPIPTLTPFPETPPADPTANWKTYTNGVISFKYPENWTVLVADTEEAMFPKGTISLKSAPAVIDIRLVVQQGQTNPKDTLQDFVRNTFGDFQTQITASDSNSAKGYFLQIGPEGSQLKINLRVISDGKKSLIAETVLPDDKIYILDQILSTFQFLN